MREHGKALRYGVGVGKAGLEFSGTAAVEEEMAALDSNQRHDQT